METRDEMEKVIERELVEIWRSADDDGRQAIYQTARALARLYPRDDGHAGKSAGRGTTEA